jgi:hypothetical protein
MAFHEVTHARRQLTRQLEQVVSHAVVAPLLVPSIRNVKANKCVTIAGGESPANNVEAVQFNCDTDLSRRWTIRLKL